MPKVQKAQPLTDRRNGLSMDLADSKHLQLLWFTHERVELEIHPKGELVWVTW